MRSFCEAFHETVTVRGDAVALRSGDGAVEFTWTEYADHVSGIAAGLAALGVGPGSTVALMTTNRPEFALSDTAVMHLGATPFSVYATSSPEQINHVFRNAGNRIVICETIFLPQIRGGLEGTEVDTIICIGEAPEGTLALSEVEAAEAPAEFDFEASWRAVQGADVATLIYTSGTTGPPKGVELTHANLLAQVELTQKVLPLYPEDRSISYLPLAHIADRWVNQYMHLVVGQTVTFVPDPRAIMAALPSIRPTVWGAVPRIWEKLKAALEARGLTDPAALPQPARAAVLEQLGLDHIRQSVSGAAPIPAEVLEYFLAFGLRISEVWGMSELSCCVTANPLDDIRIGTVGKPLPGIELRLAEDGEVLVRGATVMRGYRGQPGKTAETIDADGWLATGDIGTLDEDGYLTIIDRKKELIINSSGKNISPAQIEAVLKASSPLIGQAVCIGDNRQYNVALLVLDPDVGAGRAASDPEVAADVATAVARANERLSRVEQIKRYRLFDEEWLPGGDELTPTMKLKRRPIAEKYSRQIEELYAADPVAA
jgi:long-chain acyl-CoA synthetase